MQDGIQNPSTDKVKEALPLNGVSWIKILINIMVLVVGAVIIVLIIVALPWILLATGINSLPNPSQPAITHGEFPFRLEYEINGQRMVIQDTLICEYDGVGSNEASGKYRKWEERLASGKERVTLLKVDDRTEIYYYPGSANYYMGDSEGPGLHDSYPNAIISQRDGRITSGGTIQADELLTKYKIRLLSRENSRPIKNSFSNPENK